MTPDAEQPAPAAPLAVVLDVGEVLIDETRVWSTWAGLLGVSPLTLSAVLGAAIVQGDDWPAALDHLAPNLDWRDLEDEHERRYGGFTETDLYPDVRTTLSELAGQPLRVVIAGNQPARRQAQLESLELGVDAIATSEALGIEKPEPGFWDKVLELCEVQDPRRILYVGDRVDNDIEPATSAGLMTCWLQRGPWGQLQDLPDGLEVDLVLEGLGELPEVLGSWIKEAEGNPNKDQP